MSGYQRQDGFDHVGLIGFRKECYFDIFRLLLGECALVYYNLILDIAENHSFIAHKYNIKWQTMN